MINNADFAKRLQKVIDFNSESASSFAEKIGVQRSTISHILSGRNKPSLEFVLKVLAHFPEVELYWLMNGKGQFPAQTKNDVQNQKQTEPKEHLFSNRNSDENSKNNSKHIESENTPSSIISNSKKEIDRIVIFYKDGSFSNFEN
ncbi:helix-turn-helix domain-containing protein [Bizionia gelidisalsuginis]|uniref:Helix-turn-helix domain-containing protein n=2 Tax=Bizionia TaxID=283785 RepID=A0A8H2QJX1_9FLAO|nr:MULTISPECIES: helix-turn-helix transcriptional regulator [Bizionia]TYB76751.1 helix-turn-helix domain-containing protein [Bizionia saleffrena]TYC11983.1 helix-turn-helix domain-containing protein [Bizionia gelidisalsuginis]